MAILLEYQPVMNVLESYIMIDQIRRLEAGRPDSSGVHFTYIHLIDGSVIPATNRILDLADAIEQSKS